MFVGNNFYQDDIYAMILNKTSSAPVANNGKGNSVVVTTERADNYNKTLWHLIKNTNYGNPTGSYKIFSVPDGLCLTQSGDQVVLAESSGYASADQSWYIGRHKDGGWLFISCNGFKTIELPDNQFVDGKNLILSDINDSDSQCFNIYKAVLPRDASSYTISADKTEIYKGEKVNITVKTTGYVYEYRFRVIKPDGTDTGFFTTGNDGCCPDYVFEPDMVGTYTVFASVRSPLDYEEGSPTYKSLSIKVSEAPQVISSYIIAEAGDQQVKLTWEPVVGAAKYKLYKIENGTAAALLNVAGTTYTVTGLTNGTEYGFYVRAIIDGKAQPAGDTVYVTPKA